MAKSKRSAAAGPTTIKPNLQDLPQSTQDKPKVNLADGAALKRALDEAAISAVVTAGYQEDHAISNLKIGFSLATCAFAAVAQFYPKKYPDNWMLLAICILAYLAGTAVLNLYIAGREGDAFMFTKRRKGLGHELRISSNMPRFSETYSMSISSTRDSNRSDVSMKSSCTKYFDADGLLASDVLQADVSKLLNDWESQSKKL